MGRLAETQMWIHRFEQVQSRARSAHKRRTEREAVSSSFLRASGRFVLGWIHELGFTYDVLIVLGLVLIRCEKYPDPDIAVMKEEVYVQTGLETRNMVLHIGHMRSTRVGQGAEGVRHKQGCMPLLWFPWDGIVETG